IARTRNPTNRFAIRKTFSNMQPQKREGIDVVDSLQKSIHSFTAFMTGFFCYHIRNTTPLLHLCYTQRPGSQLSNTKGIFLMSKPGKTGIVRVINAFDYSMKGLTAAWRFEAAF